MPALEGSRWQLTRLGHEQALGTVSFFELPVAAKDQKPTSSANSLSDDSTTSTWSLPDSSPCSAASVSAGAVSRPIGSSTTAAGSTLISRSYALRRPVGLLHCVMAFFFNTTVLALAVNIGAGLLM